MYSRVQYISQGATTDAQLRNIQSVLDAGYSWVQLRFKNQEEHVLLKVAAQVKNLCDQYHATFIMNDHVHLAKAVDASGVHLGLTDMGIASARNILGNEKIIGGTANTLQDVRQRIAEGCNYIGLGPYRFTKTKEKLSPILGLEGYERIMNALSAEEKAVPIYAIGGIEQNDIELLRNTGVYSIAASGLLTQQYIPQNLSLHTSSMIAS